MLQKVRSYELSEKRLPITIEEQRDFAMPSTGCGTSIWPWADTSDGIDSVILKSHETKYQQALLLVAEGRDVYEDV